MISIERGITFKYDTDNNKILGNVIIEEVSTRQYKDIESLFIHKINGNPILYYMFRGVHLTRDEDLFLKYRLRYDITVLPPLKIGNEFVKTKGHYHPKVNNKTYPEIYEVLSGNAIYLLQKKNSEVSDVIAIFANAGDVVYIPPNYGHVTINPSRDFLIMSNLVNREFKSLYEEYEKLRGAAYYCIEDQGVKFIKNKNYGNIPEIKVISAEEVKWLSSPLYSSFIENPDYFMFLNDPEKYSGPYDSY